MSNWQDIGDFTDSSGTLAVTNSADDHLWPDALPTTQDEDGNDINAGNECPFFDEEDTPVRLQPGVTCTIPMGSSYEIRGTNLITVDTEEPDLADASAVRTGIGYDPGDKEDVPNRKNSIKVSFADTASDTGDAAGAPGSGIDASTVVPSAFSVSGNTVESVQVAGNHVYLTLSDNLGSTEKPTVSIQSGVIKDKAGNAYGGARREAEDISART